MNMKILGGSAHLGTIFCDLGLPQTFNIFNLMNDCFRRSRDSKTCQNDMWFQVTVVHVITCLYDSKDSS